jgi:hypothetical protein
MPKKTKIPTLPQPGKNTSVSFSPSSPRLSITKPEILKKRPKWRFCRMDWAFSIQYLKAETCDSDPQSSSERDKVKCCLHVLSDRLKSYETMTWGEIIHQDKTGSHFISIDDLKSHNRNLYNKFEKLLIDDGVDEPFSLRIGTKERLWGIILSDGTFEAVCYDPLHLGWVTKSS